MAKPRVFISSTYYDLKHIRSSLEDFINTLGYEPILSEKGDIASTPEVPLDESCYREVTNADIFVIIIGGRYGSAASTEDREPSGDFHERYDSITKSELKQAIESDIPIFILIEKQVKTEHEFWCANPDKKEIIFPHVDSENIFLMIDHILALPRNNPVHTFEKYQDIEGWLKEQWAGFFRELLSRHSRQQQIKTLTSQVDEMKEMNKTLKRYLEAIITGLNPDESKKIISEEENRLETLTRVRVLTDNKFARYLVRVLNMKKGEALDLITLNVSSIEQFMDKAKEYLDENYHNHLIATLKEEFDAVVDLNEARNMFGLHALLWRDSSDME